MRRAQLLLAAVLVPTHLLLSGCATIINGRSQDVPFNSHPSGANVNVSGARTTTPGKLTLRRDQDYNAVFTKDGYPERHVGIVSRPSFWLLGNLLIGGLIGLVIDFAAGGGYSLSPDSIDVDLQTGIVKGSEKIATSPLTVQSTPRQTLDATTFIQQERIRAITEQERKGLITADEAERRRRDVLEGR